MDTIDSYNLDWLMQTPMHIISKKVSHDYTSRIPFGPWKNFATAENPEEVKQTLAEYLDPEGNYKLVSERGILSTKLTFVNKNRQPQEHPGKVGFYTHFRISPGISKKSLLEEIAEVQE